jgi:DNA-directed RNA polymerase specialized sigma24 family protein
VRRREIGERLGVSEDAARMRIKRAEAELEKIFRRLEKGR